MAQKTTKTTTHTSNVDYDLISVLYHSLESAQTYESYIKDAEKDGSKDLVQFFQQIQNDEIKRSEQAKELLAQRLH